MTGVAFMKFGRAPTTWRICMILSGDCVLSLMAAGRTALSRAPLAHTQISEPLDTFRNRRQCYLLNRVTSEWRRLRLLTDNFAGRSAGDSINTRRPLLAK